MQSIFYIYHFKFKLQDIWKWTDGTYLVYRNWNKEHNVTISTHSFKPSDQNNVVYTETFSYSNETVCMPDVITNYTTSDTECTAITTHHLGQYSWFPINCSQRYKRTAVVCQSILELNKLVLNRLPYECGIHELTINNSGVQCCVKIQNTAIMNNDYTFNYSMRHDVLRTIAIYAFRLNYQKIKMKRLSNFIRIEQCLFLESYDHILKQQSTGDIGYHSFINDCSEKADWIEMRSLHTVDLEVIASFLKKCTDGSLIYNHYSCSEELNCVHPTDQKDDVLR